MHRRYLFRGLSRDVSSEKGADHRLGAMHIADFEEGPAAEAAMVVDRRDPVRLHRLPLVLCVDPPVALDLDDQVERVGEPIAVIDLQDEIGAVAALAAGGGIGTSKPRL